MKDNKSVREYRRRRAERMKKDAQERYDSVEAFRERRAARLRQRMDAGIGWAYGLAKSKGIDTTDMTPEEVFEALKEKGSGGKNTEKNVGKNTPKNAAPAAKDWLNKAKATKGVTMHKHGAFEIPTFDEPTFTEDFEAKKEIAREAAKSLVPQIKKRLSTDIKPITRPKVDQSTRNYVRANVKGATDEQIEQGIAEAAKIYEYWEKNEPAITDAVVGAVKSVGGTMDGLNNRLKFDKSLAKKAVADAINPNLEYGGDVGLAAEGIKDGARYTAVFGSDNFVEGYNKVKESLEKMGIREYRCKNFFSQYKEQDGTGNKKIGEQKSVQSVFETPDGQKFELQFHTPETLAAKEVNHPTYKQKREPPSEWAEYNKPRSMFVRDTSSIVPDPKDVFGIKEHKRGENGYK